MPASTHPTPASTGVGPEATLRAGMERASACAAQLNDELAGIVESQTDSNLDDEHDSEGPTVGFERARTMALLASARALVDEFDLAIQRMDGGIYGRCQICGQAIAPARLEALPTARACMGCAGENSKSGLASALTWP